MVANLPESRAPVAAALLVCLLFVMPVTSGQGVTLPGTPAQLYQLALDASTAKLMTNGVTTMFFNANNTTTFSVDVINTGNDAAPKNTVPAYFFLNATARKTVNQCRLIDQVIPAATTDPQTQTTTPGRITVTYTFTMPDQPAIAPAWNASYYLNRAPPSGVVYEPCVVGGAANPGYTTSSATRDSSSVHSDAEHQTSLYFLRDRRVEFQVTALHWCTATATVSADAFPDPADCADITAQPDPVNNKNKTTTAPSRTFFKVDVRNNVPGGSWVNNLSPNGSAWAIPFTITASGANVPSTVDPLRGKLGFIEAGSPSYIVGELDLNHTYGNYTVQFNLNKRNATSTLPTLTMNATNTAITKIVNVADYDFVAGVNATDFATDAFHPYPFPFENNELHIRGTVSITNNGTGAPAAKPHLIAWIDVPTNAHFFVNYSESSAYKQIVNRTKDRTAWLQYDVIASSLPNNAFYLGPGQHTLHVEVDDASSGAGEYYESNETNNILEIPIFVNTTTGPQLNAPGPFLTMGGQAMDASTNPEITSIRPHEEFHFQANVTEGPPAENGDTRHLTVTANFSVASNRSLYQTFPMVYVQRQTGAMWVAKVSTLDYLGPGSTEELVASVEAKDPFGHQLPTPVTKKLTLVKWPIQVINDTDILVTVHEDAALAKNDTVEFPYEAQTPAYEIIVYRDWTGFINNGLNASEDQILKTDNLAFTLYPPKGGAPIPLGFASQEGRKTTVVRAPGASTDWNTTYTNNPPTNYHFLSPRELSSSRAGTWHVIINISDVSGEVRHIYRNFTLRDALPRLQNITILDITDGKNDTKSANAGDTVRVRVNASDDFDINDENVSVVWTRKSDNYTMNISMKGRGARTTPEPDQNAYNYTSTLSVGRNANLNRSGLYRVTFVAQDTNGNWNTSAPVEYTLNESGRVQFNKENSQTGVDSPSAELKAPVTFYAHVASQYNPRVLLTVSADGVILPSLDHVEMLPPTGTGQDENFTFTTAFNLSGVYHYTMELVPSAGGAPADTNAGDVSVTTNLGPRIQLRQPTFQSGGFFYAPAAPLLSFLTYDEQGVDNTTFNLTVKGVTVHPTISPAPAGLKGYYFEYAVPNTEGLRFVDGDHVDVNVTVFDLTGLDPTKESLESFLNFTFVVDARPPGAKITDFEPRYKSGASTLYNVSLATKFTIVASKDDDSPVPVDHTVYSIVGGGRSVTATYNNVPFTLADNPDVYAGSTVYTISVWAYDAVGNSNVTHPQLYSVFLDDQNPHLALKQTKERFVNLTIVDDQTGVKSVTLWARVGNEGYKPYPMTKDAVGDIWRGLLPEAKRGETIAWYAQAIDNVDNNLDNRESFGTPTVPFDSYIVPNHEPTIKNTSPAIGSSISRVRDLEWTASDADDDPLTFTILRRGPGQDTWTEIIKLDASGARKYSFDTATVADGEYTFRVAVSDGSVSRSSETTVTIINNGSAIGAVGHPDSVLPGDTVLLTADIRKAGATVEAQLYREGTLVETYGMSDDGVAPDVEAGDHIYSANVPITASGDYSVTILAHYPVGGEMRTEEQLNAASFTAKLTPAYIVATYAGLLIVLSLLAVVGIAIAIFVVVRRKG